MSSRLAISSMSLGRAWVHDFETKLKEAARHGIQGIEAFYEDIQYFAKTFPGGLTPANEIKAARKISAQCSELGLKVISLQPCWCDEGLLDRTAWTAKLEEIKHKIKIAQALGTDLVLIPSSINVPAEKLSENLDAMARDLREVADLGAAQGIKFAHESLCWGTRSDTWQTSWDLVTRVDRPNFGICLDTFNIAGRVFADPAAASGRTPNAAEALKDSLAELVDTVDASKVWLVQVVDAEQLSSPLQPGHEFHVDGQPARMNWSRNCRLFYGEHERGAYLPVKEVVDAIFTGLGWRGWTSMELFNRSMNDADPSVPASHAQRAFQSWQALTRDCDIESAVMAKRPQSFARSQTSAVPLAIKSGRAEMKRTISFDSKITLPINVLS